MEDTKLGISNSLFIFSAIILVLLPLFGIIPFNSALLTLIYSYHSTSILIPVGLLSGGLLSLILTFFISLIFIRRIWNKRKEMIFDSIHKFTVLFLILVFILTSSFLENRILPFNASTSSELKLSSGLGAGTYPSSPTLLNVD